MLGKALARNDLNSAFILAFVRWLFTFLSLLTVVPYPPILHSNFSRGCNSINVSWSPPAREARGRPITGYLAQTKKSSSGEKWKNCTALNDPKSTSCAFKNLKPNTKYDVRVLAKNRFGYGWPSVNLEVSTKNAGILNIFFCCKYKKMSASLLVIIAVSVYSHGISTPLSFCKHYGVNFSVDADCVFKKFAIT